jgi:hypothetical protein
MAQANNNFQIYAQAGVNGVGWTAVINPIIEARQVTIVNPDISENLLLATDPDDPAGTTETIPAGGTYVITLGAKKVTGFQVGDTVCYLQGSGATPIARFAV